MSSNAFIGSAVRVAGAVLLLLIFAGISVFAYRSWKGQTKMENLGVENGRFWPCPDKPNCVCSQSVDPRHKIDPLPISGPEAAGRVALIKILEEMGVSEIVSNKENYIHAVFRSKVFRFPDDIEFFLDPERGRIDVRSVSRVGYSDFGVNRRRVEQIRLSLPKVLMKGS